MVRLSLLLTAFLVCLAHPLSAQQGTAGLHGQVVDIDVSPIVFASYQVPGTGADIKLAQARVPDVQLPANVDIAVLGEIGLRILGLDREGAHELAPDRGA